MHHLIYLSRATAPFLDEQLQELLLQARTKNARLDVTGLLLYGNEQFMQVLEGEQAVVHALYDAIKRDPRHRDAVAYADKAIEQRAFAGWAMAFAPASPARFTDLAGYLAPAEASVDTTRLRQVDTQLIELLRSFVLP